jgi:hypothetical protein
MAKSKAEQEIESAIAHAAAQVAKATDADEATKWQGIQNQQVANLRVVQGNG